MGAEPTFPSASGLGQWPHHVSLLPSSPADPREFQQRKRNFPQGLKRRREKGRRGNPALRRGVGEFLIYTQLCPDPKEWAPIRNLKKSSLGRSFRRSPVLFLYLLSLHGEDRWYVVIPSPFLFPPLALLFTACREYRSRESGRDSTVLCLEAFYSPGAEFLFW